MDEGIKCKCECCCSMIECEYDKDYDQFNFTLWDRGYGSSLIWSERIRWAWNILRTGNPFKDHTIVSPKGARALAEYINKNQKNES